MNRTSLQVVQPSSQPIESPPTISALDQTDRTPAAPTSTASVFFIAATFYLATALAFDHLDNPEQAYFDQLASSFAVGRLDLPAPVITSDLTHHNGRWYVPIPPLPAVLMLPSVLVTGGVRVVLLSIFFAALAVAATHGAIRALQATNRLPGHARHADFAAAALAGSALWYASVDGQVWYLAQVCATGMFALSAWIATARRGGFASGVCLALALLGRPHMLLGLPFILALRPPPSALAGRALATLLPCLAALAGLAAYNQARFGSPFDSGYLRQNVDDDLRVRLETHGQFSAHFVPENLWTMTLKPPLVDWARLRIEPEYRGFGLIWALPICGAFLTSRRWFTPSIVRWALVAVGLIACPLAAYYNGGWAQMGYRFSLDFLVPLALCLAAAIPVAPARFARAALAGGLLLNAWGTYCWFVR